MRNTRILFSISILFLSHYDNYQNTVLAEQCGNGDDIACFNGGVCTNGAKSYAALGLPELPSLLVPSIRDMHCSCPNEPAYAGHASVTGVHCDIPYEVCPDHGEHICFNGGVCEREQFRSGVYHCLCPQDPQFDVWAGKSCEHIATDFCEEDEFFDLTGGKWFCTQGGTCNNGEKNLANKCTCPSGTFGLHCEYSEAQECTLNCMNGGKCQIGLKDFSHMEDYGLDILSVLGGQDIYGQHCVCPEGYSGVKCETEDVVRCGKGICFNGAECVETVSLDGTKVYNQYCRCKQDANSAFAGKFCEHEATTYCPAPYGHNPDEYFCTNGGMCPENPHLPCICKDGFSGPKCEIPPQAESNNECDLTCLNGGECFFGDSPVVDKDLQNLRNSGLGFLLDNKHCRCPEGFIGIRCEMKYEKCGDHEHYCLHGSGCVPDGDEFTCDCREAATSLTSYAGKYCEHAATEFCQGPGSNPGSFCTNHGTCLGGIGKGQDHVGCQCQSGWTGQYCEYEQGNVSTGIARTTGVAMKAFAGFVGTLSVIVVIFVCILFIVRKRRGDRDIEYEDANADPRKRNPYGELDSDLSDDSDEDYEFTEVAII